MTSTQRLLLALPLLLLLNVTPVLSEEAVTGTPGAAPSKSAEPPVQPGIPVVMGIVVKGLRKISEEEVRKRIGVKVGQPYNPAQADRDFLELWNWKKDEYPFLNISIRPVPAEKGVVIEYDFEERPVVSEVNWRYLDENGNGTEEHLLKPRHYPEARAPKGKPYNESEVAAGVEDIRKAYLKKGITGTAVATEIRPAPGEPEDYPAQVILTYTITEGEKHVVSGVRFEGNASLADRELLKAMKDKTTLSLYTDDIAMSGWWYYKDELAKFLQYYYRQRGFLDAVVYAGEPSPTLSSVLHRPCWILVYEVDEGFRYRIGDVSIKGNRVLTEKEIRNAMKLSDYPFYSLDIEDVLKASIRRRYGMDGRIFSYAAIDRSFGDGHTIDLSLRLSEDNVRKVRMIEPRGNTVTKDSVIRREFAIKPGDTYSQKRLDQTMRNLYNTRFFETFNPRPFPVGDDQVDLMFDLTEAKTNQFQIALTYSSELQFVGTLALKYGNFDLFNPRNGFRGGGQQFELTYENGSEYSNAEMKFTEPWFLGMPVELQADVFDRTETAGRQWEETRTGARLSFTRRYELDETQQKYFMLGATLENQTVGISDIDPAVPLGHPIRSEEGQFTLSSAGVNAALNFVDNWRLPSSGFRLKAWGEVFGEALGGERDFIKYGASADAFIPLYKGGNDRNHVLSFKLRAEWADAYSDTSDVPVYERYFAGGIFTVRGYEYRSLGPRFPDDPTGDPVGGDFSFVGNVEYLMPLVPKHWIGVLFFDAGNVWTSVDDFDPADVRMSYGFGFRIEPMGVIPITLFWGTAINPEPGDKTEHFTFTLGTFF